MKGNYDIYRIHVDSFLRLHELFGDYSHKDDLFIDLPNVDGLDKAVCLINKLVGQKLQKQREYLKNEYLSTKAHEIKDIIKKNTVESVMSYPLFKELLKEVYEAGIKEGNKK